MAVFNGTAGADEIEITIQAGGAQSIISINGVNNLTPDTSITINAGGGNDTFEVFTSGAESRFLHVATVEMTR